MQHHTPGVSRRAALAGIVGGGALGAAGCSIGSVEESTRHSVAVRSDGSATVVAVGADETLMACRALFTRATAVVVSGSPADAPAPARAARRLGVPLLLDRSGLEAELERLGTRTVVTFGRTGSLGSRRVVHAAADGSVPDIAGLPVRPPSVGAVALTPESRPPSPALAAVLAAAGTRVVPVSGVDADPRQSHDTIALLRSKASVPVLGLGAGFGAAGRFAARVHTARTAKELPGGGVMPFPRHHMVALYGHPGTSSLGLLGEQSAPAAVTRARKLTDEYAALISGPVMPAFEIIATVASGSRQGGTYSARTPISQIEPWLDEAERAGVYAVLDLQPGRADFLTQAKAYERLLTRPWVGLALDPEWRLGPNDLPLQRIGSVGVEEVNATSAWLAGLVRDHGLPPKVFTIHQFQTRMIRGRDRLVTDHDELQIVVHVDGSGSQSDKQSTWRAIRAGLPTNVWLGWKNFIDEDHPMLTPAQTVAQVTPTPQFISYQ